MKNATKLFGIIALIGIIGFTMAACDDKDSGGSPFDGTWNGRTSEDEQIRIVIDGSTFTVYWIEEGSITSLIFSATGNTGNFSGEINGTVTVSGNTLIVTFFGIGTFTLYK